MQGLPLCEILDNSTFNKGHDTYGQGRRYSKITKKTEVLFTIICLKT